MQSTTHTLSRIAVITMVMAVSAHAAVVVSTDPTTAVGGTTFTVEGTSFDFPVASKYSSVTDSGSDRTATIAASPPNNDFYIDKGGLSLDTTVYRYAHVFYSLGSAFTGSTQQLRLDTSDQAANFVTFTGTGAIPASAGAHSFVIDLVDGTNLGGAGYSGNLTNFRWDWWNNGGNTTKAFTIDCVVFGSEQSVPVVPDFSFENADVQSGEFKQANGGGTGSLVGSGWDFTDAHGITHNTSAFSPPSATDGVLAAMVRSGGDLSTTVTDFVAGATYSLSFDAAGRSGSPNEFQVLLGGQVLTFASATTLLPAGDATYVSYTSDDFTTVGGSLLLVFDGLTSGDRTTFLDNVSINFVAAAPIPTPAALPAGLALIGIVAMRRRRR